VFRFLVGEGFHGLFKAVNDRVFFGVGLFVLKCLECFFFLLNRKHLIGLVQNRA
jgi:hypothetical protein